MSTVGVICPSVFERQALRGVRFPKGTRLAVSGMGKLRALEACHHLVRDGQVTRLALIGFAGSLTDALSVGDVIEPDLFIEQDYCAEPFEKFPNLIKRSGKALLAYSRPATLLTQDRFLTANPYKGTAYQKRHPRLACDMESYAVAFFCKAHKVPLAVAKIISDVADEQADHDFLKACRMLAPKLKTTAAELVRRLAGATHFKV